MKEIAVISGKGGSGKTSVSSSLASLADNCVICDCDVESPNLHIVIRPEIKFREEFYGMPRADIDQDKCIQCGVCWDFCRFSAISEEYVVSIHDCEGCSACYHLCPVEAIKMLPHVAGEWFKSDSRYGPIYHARLGIGEENSGKLVAFLREKTHEGAEKSGADYIIVDGPPGIGCPTIATISNCDLAVIVAEASVAALHDMLRTVELCRHFGIDFGVIINKSDLNPESSKEIKKFCARENIPIFGELPFKQDFREAVNQLIPPAQFSTEIHDLMVKIWGNIQQLLIKKAES